MKRETTVIRIAIFSLFLILLSCTLPVYIVTTPAEVEKVITATPEESAADTATAEPTLTATFDVTPTVSVNLDGNWTIWQGTSQQELEIDFMQDGYSIVGNAATNDGHSMLFKGTISHDGQNVSGTWESTKGTSGTFTMYLEGAVSSFSGNMGGGVPFCGNRLSATMPSPCLK